MRSQALVEESLHLAIGFDEERFLKEKLMLMREEEPEV